MFFYDNDFAKPSAIKVIEVMSYLRVNGLGSFRIKDGQDLLSFFL